MQLNPSHQRLALSQAYQDELRQFVHTVGGYRQCDQMLDFFSKSCPKSSSPNFPLKSDVFQKAEKITKYLFGLLWNEFFYQ